MFRISVSTLEKFRRVKLGLTQFDTEEALIQAIRGLFTGNDKTKTGGAFHKVIEGEYKVLDSEEEWVLADEFLFTRSQAAPAIAYKKAHPSMIHEIPVNKIYSVGDYAVKVSGRVDGLEGMHVRDPKTIYKTPNLQDYIDSYQWRYYLELLGLDVFYYDVFEVRGFKSLPSKMPYVLARVEFLAPVDIQCLRYTDMDKDCEVLLREFMSYIESKNLLHILKIDNEPALL